MEAATTDGSISTRGNDATRSSRHVAEMEEERRELGGTRREESEGLVVEVGDLNLGCGEVEVEKEGLVWAASYWDWECDWELGKWKLVRTGQ